MSSALEKQAATLQHWQQAIAACGPALKQSAIVDVPANSAAWVDSGITLAKGDSVTLLAVGSAHVLDMPQLPFAPDLFLCHRISPQGAVDKFPDDTVTLTADSDGALQFVAQFPGAWADPQGTLDPAWPREAAGGEYRVAVLVWEGAADDGLALFAAQDGSGLGAEALRAWVTPSQSPEGWAPLWRIGATQVFAQSQAEDRSPRIRCKCCGDGGILKYPVDYPLDEQATLDWQWRATALPSQVAEDTLPTHDYLSIAVEFDNGLDLTYMWSATLPEGHFFQCPFPWWDKHETHQVVRSGTQDLGRWQSQQQSILADYRRAIGGPEPKRIVGIWLIAVSVFQRQNGECEYRGIRLSGSQAAVEVASA